MLSQTTTQVQRQTQRLTPQQVQLSRLMEMPVEALYDEVDKELKENPTLEAVSDETSDTSDYSESSEYSDNSVSSDSSDYSDTSDFADNDDIPVSQPTGAASGTEPVAADTLSFYDQLQEQIGFFSTSEQQRQLIEYLIGSLDERGWLPVSLQQVQDELEVYHNMDVTLPELEEALHTLQHFEPAGIGARDLRECLLLQVERAGGKTQTADRSLMERLLREHFDLLMLNRWDKIAQRMHLTDAQTRRLQHDVRRLNPRPGSSMGEAVGKSLQQITPDFFVDTDYYGQISLSLNNGYVPTLQLSPDDEQALAAYDGMDAKKLSRAERDAQTFLRDNVTRARNFIEAIEGRRHTLLLTMRAIIRLQRPFFETGDETALRPMTLDDIARQTGLHISTISRVTASKWVQTTFGIYPLRWFFSSASSQDGEEVSVRKAEAALQELVDHEDKRNPLSDDIIAQRMQAQGFDVARRTVSKYRDRMGIPVARMRKQNL